MNLAIFNILSLRLVLVLAAYSFCRLLFLIFNIGEISGGKFLPAFLFGLQFDLSAIAYTNAFFIILSILPFKFASKRKFQQILRIIFFISNGIALLTNVIDIEFYKFIGKRTDFTIFDITSDVNDQAGQLILNYIHIPLIFAFLMVIMWKLYPINIANKKASQPLSAILIYLLTILAIPLFMRGGFQLKPITPIIAFNNTNSKAIANLTLNTPFTLIHSYSKNTLTKKNWFSDEELSHNLPPKSNKSDSLNASRSGQNVVFIILESFSAEFVGHLNEGKGFTPFLDSIAQEGISFHNHFANGRTSVQSISSLLAGIPSLLNGSISTSVYQTNQFYSLFRELKTQEYTNLFFHAGKNGTMNFDQYTKQMGFEYFGLDEYPYPDDYDGTWGIFDEPYLQYCVDEISAINQPFTSIIFTLSSHQPYTLPGKYKERFNKGEIPIQNSIQYTDHALHQFFEKARQQSWFDSTLFIFTADHAHYVHDDRYKTYTGPYRTPLIMYHPKLNLSNLPGDISQQVDIPVSIASFLGMPLNQFPQFGRPIFGIDQFYQPAQRIPEAIIYDMGFYFLIRKDGYIKIIDEQIWGFFDADTDIRLEDPPYFGEMLNRLKAYVQYFNENMIENSFVQD